MRLYVERLRQRGDLMVVDKEVDPAHELAAVTHAGLKRWGKPILFNKVKGSRFPVVTNVYGSRERLAEILGIDPANFCRQWNSLMEAKAAGSEPFDQVEDDDLIDCKLSDLPLITYSDGDAAPYFTSALFIAKDPDTGIRNLSFHRSMYVDDKELRCRLAPRHHLTVYHEKAEKAGKPLEAAMLIGTPPTAFLTAAAPLPYDADELEVAAQLRGSAIPMRKCRHIDLEVPAETEIVIEGRFLPNERRLEGPFGEFMGYYVQAGPNAVFEVLGVTARKDAVFHSILCGTEEEVLTLSLSISANIYKRLSDALPGIVDVTCLPFVNHVVIQLDTQYDGHARQVMMSAIGAEPVWAKAITVVDTDVNIYDLSDVMWAVLTRSRVDKDIVIVPETPSFFRDPHKDHWGRLLIDATKPFDRKSEFERKKLRLGGTIDLKEWFGAS